MTVTGQNAGDLPAAPTVRQWLQRAVDALDAAGVAGARPSAELLLLFVLERDRAFLYAHPEHRLPPEQEQRLAGLLEQRARGVPVQYLTGHREFFGRDFRVTPEVLIPRPETELAVEAVLELMRSQPEPVLADVGTGSGCIAITLALERPEARVFATDLSAGALAIARENAGRLGAERVVFLQGDLLEPLAGAAAAGLDAVVSNPPYIGEEEMAGLQREVREFEPALALTPGPTGLEVYRRLIPQARARLRAGGWLVLELGYQSAAGVRALLGQEWDQVAVRPDLQGWDRVLLARKPLAGEIPALPPENRHAD